MKIFSVLLALCAGNSPVTGELPSQRPVTWNFEVFFDLCLNKQLNKQSWGWWFETPSRSLWRHCNVYIMNTPPLLLSRLTWEAKFSDMRRFASRLWLLRADESHMSKITHSEITGSCFQCDAKWVLMHQGRGRVCPNENSDRAEAYWLKSPRSWSNHTLCAGPAWLVIERERKSRERNVGCCISHIKTGRLKQVWSSTLGRRSRSPLYITGWFSIEMWWW